MKRAITDRVRELGYRVETLGHNTHKVFKLVDGNYEYVGIFTKEGLKREFGV